MKIALCASLSFYEHVTRLEDELLALGHQPLIPEMAKTMKAAGNFSKDPLRNAANEFSDYSQKTKAMREHFDEIKQAEAILVVNDEKHGQANYIGPNVLMEMAVAFSLSIPIYLLNDMPAESIFLDEISGLEPVTLGGNIKKMHG